MAFMMSVSSTAVTGATAVTGVNNAIASQLSSSYRDLSSNSNLREEENLVPAIKATEKSGASLPSAEVGSVAIQSTARGESHKNEHGKA